MNENTKFHIKTTKVFENVKRIFYQEMSEYVQNFAQTIKEEQSLEHSMLDGNENLLAAIYICIAITKV